MDKIENHAEAASYQISGYGQKMGWGSRPALCLIDVCKAYWTPGSPLDTSSNPESAASPESMRRLLAAAREGGVPVIWTQVLYTRPDMADAGIFWLKSKTLSIWQKGDTRGLDACMPGLEPGPEDTVVVKRYPSAFFGTDLATQLHFMNVDTLVLCGVSTSGCVRASTLDTMQYGYRPIVVGSACGDRSPEIHNANLFDLNAKYADVVEEAEAVEKLKAGWKKTADF